MRKLAFAAAVLAGLLVTQAAPAAELFDADDSASRLDLRKVEVVAEHGGTGTVKVVTYGKWKSRFLRDANPTTLRVLFDDGADGDADLVGNFRYKRGALLLFLRSADGSNHYEPVPAERNNRRSVSATFPFDVTELASDDLSVWARIVDAASSGCREAVCRDRGPDSGGVRPY